MAERFVSQFERLTPSHTEISHFTGREESELQSFFYEVIFLAPSSSETLIQTCLQDLILAKTERTETVLDPGSVIRQRADVIPHPYPEEIVNATETIGTATAIDIEGVTTIVVGLRTTRMITFVGRETKTVIQRMADDGAMMARGKSVSLLVVTRATATHATKTANVTRIGLMANLPGIQSVHATETVGLMAMNAMPALDESMVDGGLAVSAMIKKTAGRGSVRRNRRGWTPTYLPVHRVVYWEGGLQTANLIAFRLGRRG